MTNYRYGTILRAVDDDPHPDNDVEVGDIHIKAGKHEDGDQYEVMAGKQIAVVEFETVEVYELPEPGSKRKAVEYARDQYVSEMEELSEQ